MTSIERTAYPRFKRLITARELHLFFSPGLEEAQWAAERTESDEHQLALLLMLKSYQVLADNDPAEQEKALKFNSLLTNVLIFHNTLDIADVVRELQAEGWIIEPEDLARVSPYLTEHIMRFGQYSIHELGLEPEAYEPHLDVDFTKLEPDEPDGQQEAA